MSGWGGGGAVKLLINKCCDRITQHSHKYERETNFPSSIRRGGKPISKSPKSVRGEAEGGGGGGWVFISYRDRVQSFATFQFEKLP